MKPYIVMAGCLLSLVTQAAYALSSGTYEKKSADGNKETFFFLPAAFPLNLVNYPYGKLTKVVQVGGNQKIVESVVGPSGSIPNEIEVAPFPTVCKLNYIGSVTRQYKSSNEVGLQVMEVKIDETENTNLQFNSNCVTYVNWFNQTYLPSYNHHLYFKLDGFLKID
jgi:hypothetical protein